MFKLTVIPLVSQLSHDFLPFLTFQTVWYQLPIKPKINESYKLENHLKSSESKIFTYPTSNPCCISYMFDICTRFVNVLDDSDRGVTFCFIYECQNILRHQFQDISHYCLKLRVNQFDDFVKYTYNFFRKYLQKQHFFFVKQTTNDPQLYMTLSCVVFLSSFGIRKI